MLTTRSHTLIQRAARTSMRWRHAVETQGRLLHCCVGISGWRWRWRLLVQRIHCGSEFELDFVHTRIDGDWNRILYKMRIERGNNGYVKFLWRLLYSSSSVSSPPPIVLNLLLIPIAGQWLLFFPSGSYKCMNESRLVRPITTRFLWMWYAPCFHPKNFHYD